MRHTNNWNVCLLYTAKQTTQGAVFPRKLLCSAVVCLELMLCKLAVYFVLPAVVSEINVVQIGRIYSGILCYQQLCLELMLCKLAVYSGLPAVVSGINVVQIGRIYSGILCYQQLCLELMLCKLAVYSGMDPRIELQIDVSCT